MEYINIYYAIYIIVVLASVFMVLIFPYLQPVSITIAISLIVGLAGITYHDFVYISVFVYIFASVTHSGKYLSSSKGLYLSIVLGSVAGALSISIMVGELIGNINFSFNHRALFLCFIAYAMWFIYCSRKFNLISIMSFCMGLGCATFFSYDVSAVSVPMSNTSNPMYRSYTALALVGLLFIAPILIRANTTLRPPLNIKPAKYDIVLDKLLSRFAISTYILGLLAGLMPHATMYNIKGRFIKLKRALRIYEKTSRANLIAFEFLSKTISTVIGATFFVPISMLSAIVFCAIPLHAGYHHYVNTIQPHILFLDIYVLGFCIFVAAVLGSVYVMTVPTRLALEFRRYHIVEMVAIVVILLLIQAIYDDIYKTLFALIAGLIGYILRQFRIDLEIVVMGILVGVFAFVYFPGLIIIGIEQYGIENTNIDSVFGYFALVMCIASITFVSLHAIIKPKLTSNK